ncbi:helix-turn-helix transcriptional regulator [Sphingomonas sp. ID1715]|uniref:helix-turn-helix domain-containing protein n=1 Tax=Sphingomonas sp. ID1715 TaxID=1656898 RepID=UPI001488B67B|nr:helix-turn-helix transcriptional regulator [Sphingomonas sp. ID1715]NNM77388.1 helix-turn-helix transcriptional regulator [Sphingomonas sp. ID1715]
MERIAARVKRGAMARGALDQLTEAQRECLRLVYAHHNSKEIAEIVGISPSAVDKRIERAVQILGVTTRFVAARMLAAEEGVSAYEQTTSEPIDLPTERSSSRTAADEPWWLVRRLLGIAPATGGGDEARNPLTKAQRLGVIVALIFLISMSSMALLNLGQTLSSLAHAQRTAPAR